MQQIEWRKENEIRQNETMCHGRGVSGGNGYFGGTGYNRDCGNKRRQKRGSIYRHGIYLRNASGADGICSDKREVQRQGVDRYREQFGYYFGKYDGGQLQSDSVRYSRDGISWSKRLRQRGLRLLSASDRKG